MQTSNGPFDTPAGEGDPGMARPIVALSMVFLVGLACVFLIYALGDPIKQSTGVTTDTQVQTTDTPDEPNETGEAQTPTGESDTGPADPPTSDPSSTPPSSTTDSLDAAAPARPYVSPGGANPMPRHGEPPAAAIPPTRLIDDAALDAQPPESSTLPQPDGPVDWTEAHLYLDMVITVKGEIVATNNIGNICFLNYDTNWQDKFYIAMFKEAFELLPDPPEEHYLDKTLLITGKVSLHNGRPQIEVHDVSQIEVVE